MATMYGNVEELKAQGYKPCPCCGAYYDPSDPKVKEWHCSNCGADLKLSPEEAAVRLDDAELAGQLSTLNKKANFMKKLALVCVIGVFVLWLIHPLMGVAMFIPAAVFAVLSATAGSRAKVLLSNNITRDIISGVFDECIYAAGYHLPDELLHEAALIPNWDRASGSDLVSAKYKGHTINFCDIELEEEVVREDSEGNTSTSFETRFKGQWMILELGREVPAQLRLRENIKRTGRISRKLFGERIANKDDVKTENEAFNKRFQILTEDEHSAFYILTPHFMEFIMSAGNAADTRTYLSFLENRVHIACYTGRDSFELQKNDGANLDAVRTRMKSELRYITSIADELLKNEYLFGCTGEGELS